MLLCPLITFSCIYFITCPIGSIVLLLDEWFSFSTYLYYPKRIVLVHGDPFHNSYWHITTCCFRVSLLFCSCCSFFYNVTFSVTFLIPVLFGIAYLYYTIFLCSFRVAFPSISISLSLFFI